ncbi:DUF488 family protein [Filobacillus milosensis]|uniref:DUF488 family protein n=1 Tax=Filobacillus milosensis TaxID=94137 RepID=A0A4Y8IQW9_9BACI|nr:DUF488 family protein [Filobacillus milosensis]TFB22940.1 DUF488 family protein [Filobacillus milosensis]
MSVKIKRIYEDASKNDGKRVLIDRVWPRGVSKEKAQLDEWLKEVAPSSELRKWFDHDPDKFNEFKKKYKKEIKENQEQKDALDQLIKWSSKGNLTLLFAAKEEKYNHAQVLKKLIEKE